MLTLSQLEKYDQSGMHKIYDTWPKIARDSFESNPEPIDFKNIDHIVFAGMGGSGAIGDLFSGVLSKSHIHVSLVKGYLLPRTIDKNTLLVATSISGNTSETLIALESATKTKCKIICFSSGGKMEEYCKKNKIMHKKFLLTHSPRTSFLRYVYSILGTLYSVIPISKNDISESILKLGQMSNIASSNLSETNPALNLAGWLSGIPLIYYPYGLQAAAIRFKSSLQENAKSHAMTEDVIEACHNGIVSWEKKSSAQPILLEGQDDYIKTKERWKIMKEYFEKNHVDYREVFSVSGNILSKLICMIYMLDYTSIYYALLNKTDPSPIHSIDFVKKRL